MVLSGLSCQALSLLSYVLEWGIHYSCSRCHLSKRLAGPKWQIIRHVCKRGLGATSTGQTLWKRFRVPASTLGAAPASSCISYARLLVFFLWVTWQTCGLPGQYSKGRHRLCPNTKEEKEGPKPTKKGLQMISSLRCMVFCPSLMCAFLGRLSGKLMTSNAAAVDALIPI